ncbi:family 43 glycosylhydrolase [Zunongwangia sp.]|uniref:family 43 glycosylhydrolase n=1 Tax=Zunongwangia sp. TaxID=1965325 RepID=UPI003AA9600B
MDQFTADPTARVFDGKLYVFPSHDIVPPEDEGRTEWFNMADYYVVSSENLKEWTDHGKILDQNDVLWADPKAYNMWVPDAISKMGKFYFYFPTRLKYAGDGEKSFSVGVAVANRPEDPYKTQPSHIEGSFVFERNDTYYMTYPHVGNNTEIQEYGIADNPMGPFTHQGVIMDESTSETWTNHHSIVNYEDQWYLFYHDNDLSPILIKIILFVPIVCSFKRMETSKK